MPQTDSIDLRSPSMPAPVTYWPGIKTCLFVFVAIAPITGAGLGCFIRPDILAAFSLVPPWFWVLLGVPALIWSFRIRRDRWFYALILVWGAFTVGWVEEATSLTRSAKRLFDTPVTDGTVRVVSLNCANTIRCLEDLQATHPDIVLLQEIPGPDDLQRMAHELFGEEGVSLAGHDTAILARGQVNPLRFHAEGPLVSALVTLPNHRPLHCISLRRSPPVARLDFWALRFWTDHRDLRKTHRREIRLVREALSDVDSWLDHIVGGDFNATPLDPTLSDLHPTVRDAFLDAGHGLGGTGTNEFPLFRVDQIWLNFRPSQVYSQTTRHSDHRMVVCDLVIRE